MCYLRATANLSTGGIAIDRTDDIHPTNVWIAERIAKIIGLDIAGIDVVTTDISQPLRDIDGVVVEVNAAPGCACTSAPAKALPAMWQNPFCICCSRRGNPPDSRRSVDRHQWQNHYHPPYCPHLQANWPDHRLHHHRRHLHWRKSGGTRRYDRSPERTVILQDPTVEVAVLETARGGILRSGLAFKDCDIGVVLNVAADHLGLGDIKPSKTWPISRAWW
jgi:cyanophycin synthetase